MLRLPQWMHRRAAAGASDTLPVLSPGARLGGLRVERVLARGATGNLYLACHESDGAPLALKAVRLSGIADDGSAAAARERFMRESSCALALRHEGIVCTLGAATQDGVGYLVMELLAGTDLTRYTRPQRLLPEAVVLEIAARVAQALAHAHRQGVVHRDVKPANVMYDPASGAVKLTDFGLSRAADADVTRSGRMLGSPTYMAPELLAGAAPDARSDLYALGVLCYELLAGRPPFEADRLGVLLQAVATQAPPPLASLQPGLADAAALDALLAPLLAKPPADRPNDAGQWAAQARLAVQWLNAPSAASTPR